MPKIVNLTGQRFGSLTAIRATDQRRSGSVVWECQCDCGNVSYVTASNLRCSQTRSCGCSRNDGVIDLTGQRFGKLTAIRPTENRKRGSIVWECRCDCGGTVYVISSSLRSGNVRSCGCLVYKKIKPPAQTNEKEL